MYWDTLGLGHPWIGAPLDWVTFGLGHTWIGSHQEYIRDKSVQLRILACITTFF